MTEGNSQAQSESYLRAALRKPAQDISQETSWPCINRVLTLPQTRFQRTVRCSVDYIWDGIIYQETVFELLRNSLFRAISFQSLWLQIFSTTKCSSNRIAIYLLRIFFTTATWCATKSHAGNESDQKNGKKNLIDWKFGSESETLIIPLSISLQMIKLHFSCQTNVQAAMFIIMHQVL